jgi:hypothetical protein
MRASTCLALIGALSVLGCSAATEPLAYIPPHQSPAPPPPVPPAPAAPTIIFSADVYGSKWVATEITVTRLEHNTIEITGISNQGVHANVRMTLRIVEATREGEYSLNANGNGSLFSMASGWIEMTSHMIDWPTQHVRITNLSGDRMAGTFEGFVPSYSGSGEWLSLFNGRFEVVIN